MNDKSLLRTGILGSVTVGVCCFTPLLVFILGMVGLSSWLGWLDYVLLPSLAFFIALTGYGLWKRHGA